MTTTLELTQQLIAYPSITPEDAGCQTLIAKRLAAIGFTIEHLILGEVSNLWARRGIKGPLFVFAGHTDVVPTGPEAHWTSPPFIPTIKDGYLYGRGAADMKSGVAAMVTACEQFVAEYPNYPGSIALLITSDEEGAGVNGTAKVVEKLVAREVKIDWCVVGEPSSDQQLGDTIKHGRRGSLSGRLIIHGKQGHVAYPHLADNPIHNSISALAELTTTVWDQGMDSFSPTGLQITEIQAGTGAGNVIPGQLELAFNFRYSPAVTAEQLMQRVEAILDELHLDYELTWRHSGKPFLTHAGELTRVCQQAVQDVTGLIPELSTSGGTSDARFIAPTGCQVVEFGHCNATIHQVDERVRVEDIEKLSLIYQGIIKKLLIDKA